ncbi:MAG TPA: hypothetical protein PLS90_07355 [Candidatus Sumerlaeota bacterium]|nr:hypothetical protein [Candidatus Sumerlaeota bacterium]HOR28203.1 hypothetical protein [Candidatus Sumerlaeota bacterium]HPK02261.1 hypothetical protein [Candidatus Sumerlaeota bacterium]
MTRLLLLTLLYLFIALPIEVIVLPTLQGFSPHGWHFLYHWPLLALPALLLGFLRGEIAGMLMGVVAALLVCFSQPPNNSLGAMIVGLSLTGYLAGQAARRGRFTSFASRWLLLLGLLMLNQFVSGLVRRLFWVYAPLAMPWEHPFGLILTSLLGVLILKWAAPRFKLALSADDDRITPPAQGLRRTR